MISTKGHWRRVAVTGLVGLTLAGALSACGKNVDGSPDEVKCVYNNETGALDGDPMMPGSERRTGVDDQYTVVSIPMSDRFWNISDSASKDAAAPKYLPARDASYKEMHTVIEVGFRFKADTACKWFDQHGRRDGDPQFNVAGDPNTPWQRWLQRNFTALEERINQDLVQKYSWEYLEFNFPTNADKNGVLPDLPDKNPTDNVPPEKAAAALQALRQIEIDFGRMMSEQLTKALGGEQYFCGTDYKIGGECTPLVVKISSISLVDPKPVEDRKALIAQREATAIAQERAVLTRDGTEAEVAARKAEADKQAQLAEIDAKDAASKASVADAQRAQQEAEAAQKVAVCIAAAEAGLSVDCSELVSVTTGGGLRQPDRGVTVTPGS